MMGSEQFIFHPQRIVNNQLWLRLAENRRNILHNQGDTVTLAGLPAHTGVKLRNLVADLLVGGET